MPLSNIETIETFKTVQVEGKGLGRTVWVEGLVQQKGRKQFVCTRVTVGDRTLTYLNHDTLTALRAALDEIAPFARARHDQVEREFRELRAAEQAEADARREKEAKRKLVRSPGKTARDRAKKAKKAAGTGGAA